MFEFIGNIFNLFLYYPLFNSLIFIYNYIPGHDFGMAIIVLTLAIRIVLYPVAVRALQSQKALQNLQPKVLEIQKKYKDDKEAQAKATLEIYRTEKINPFSGLFLALVQLPILIALYQVFLSGLKPEQLNNLYSFVANPGHINTMFLGLVEVSHPHLVFAAGAGILQFFQTKMLLPKPDKSKPSDMASMMQTQMVYLFPIVTIVILMKLPAALGLYWIVSGIFSIAQQYWILKHYDKPRAN